MAHAYARACESSFLDHKLWLTRSTSNVAKYTFHAAPGGTLHHISCPFRHKCQFKSASAGCCWSVWPNHLKPFAEGATWLQDWQINGQQRQAVCTLPVKQKLSMIILCCTLDALPGIRSCSIHFANFCEEDQERGIGNTWTWSRRHNAMAICRDVISECRTHWYCQWCRVLLYSTHTGAKSPYPQHWSRYCTLEQHM